MGMEYQALLENATEFSRTEKRYVFSNLKSPTDPKQNKVLEIYTYKYFRETQEYVRKKKKHKTMLKQLKEKTKS